MNRAQGDEPATMRDVPRPRSYRLTDQDIELLERLVARLARSQRDVISMSLVHLWETLRRDERVHLEARIEGPPPEGEG